MNFNINGNVTVVNGQMGEINTMTVKSSEKSNLLQKKDWDELRDFLSMRLQDLPKSENSFKLAQEGLKYAERKDESGFKRFFLRNKESFINNVCSNVASSGLLILLSKLNF